MDKKDNKGCFINRELSWLKFNERVLDEATYKKNPLCEKMNFLSIYQSNLDEFYSVRVGSLIDQLLISKYKKEDKTHMTAGEQLKAVVEATGELTRKKNRIYKSLMGEIKKQGVEVLDFKSLSKEDSEYMKEYFNHNILPLLSPQVVARKNPFPFLKDKEIYAVVVLESKGHDKLGIVPCNSDKFRRVIHLPSDKNKLILTEEMILHYIPLIFDRYQIKSKSLIRIIRNADIDIDESFNDEDDDDYREAMEKLIKVRKRLSPVKMEYSRMLDESVIVSICKEIGLSEHQTFLCETPLEFKFFDEIKYMLKDNKENFFERMVPSVPDDINTDESMISQIEEKDRLLAFPYNSMKPFLKLLQEAAINPNVSSIKITLYRVSRNSRIVETLIEAAEHGKEVVVLVELRARFDEENNISWSRKLEEAGCRVIYGLDNIKVHSKICLITYQKEENISYITQIGTGNYNEDTAKVYTDYSIMTARESIGIEAVALFRNLCMEQVMRETGELLVAPLCLQNKILDLIQEQIDRQLSGQKGYIGIKINSLTDKKIMDKLIEASRNGVKIDMVIRGICCLQSGIEGVTQNIRVISIVGRYLEHSRIYMFGKGEEMKMYISSADFMTRNTTRRVEVAMPVYDTEIRNTILGMFNTMLKDNVNARVQIKDGRYQKKSTRGKIINSQQGMETV
ncbi:MAG: polyphosphate kinase 1 [Lachnospiraceae bacterium]